MFERYTEGARQVVMLAQDEARMLKQNYIGTEHILLGLLREEQGLAARVLASHDTTVEGVRAGIVLHVGVGEDVTSGQLPFTPRAKKVLDLTRGEADAHGHNYIGTEHILLGLLRENEGLAVRILDARADPDSIRDEVIRMLPRTGAGHPRAEHRRRPDQESLDAAGPAASVPGTLSDEQLEEMIDKLSQEARLLRAKVDILAAELESRRGQRDDPRA